MTPSVYFFFVVGDVPFKMNLFITRGQEAEHVEIPLRRYPEALETRHVHCKNKN